MQAAPLPASAHARPETEVLELRAQLREARRQLEAAGVRFRDQEVAASRRTRELEEALARAEPQRHARPHDTQRSASPQTAGLAADVQWRVARYPLLAQEDTARVVQAVALRAALAHSAQFAAL